MRYVARIGKSLQRGDNLDGGKQARQLRQNLDAKHALTAFGQQIQDGDFRVFHQLRCSKAAKAAMVGFPLLLLIGGAPAT